LSGRYYRIGMKEEWDARARENARWFVTKTDDEASFESSGIRDIETILADLHPYVDRDSVVLEIGCGPGRLLGPLAARVGEVHGVDVSSEMIALAARRLSTVPRIHLHENDGQTLPFANEMFDVVFSYLTFQHLPRRSILQSYVKETYRVLKPGGVFKFQVDGRADNPLWRLYRRLRRANTWRGVILTRRDVLGDVDNSGFRVLGSYYAPDARAIRRRQCLWVVCRKP
jgi:SAM-dependent methyltransferase